MFHIVVNTINVYQKVYKQHYGVTYTLTNLDTINRILINNSDTYVKLEVNGLLNPKSKILKKLTHRGN